MEEKILFQINKKLKASFLMQRLCKNICQSSATKIVIPVGNWMKDSNRQFIEIITQKANIWRSTSIATEKILAKLQYPLQSIPNWVIASMGKVPVSFRGQFIHRISGESYPGHWKHPFKSSILSQIISYIFNYNIITSLCHFTFFPPGPPKSPSFQLLQCIPSLLH